MTKQPRTILLLGSGGREHALAWKISRSPLVEKIYALPGSDGIALCPKTECISGDVLAQARSINPDLVVIGPEKPMADGVSDALAAEGFSVMAPSKAAAQLEASKVFSKEFMLAEGIPTASAEICESADAARNALSARDIEKYGVVLKADGLASGKGVVVTHNRDEALATIHDFMEDGVSTVKSSRLLIEEKLSGREVSAFALCDGETFVTLGYICDYKRVDDGDRGGNTGGMGGYAPKGWPSDKARSFVEENIFRRVVAGMKKRGTPFKGVLFAGLMVDGDDVKVIEFNVRFGDPETQILMPLIEGDIVPLLAAAATGNLSGITAPPLSRGTAVHVVLTSQGYPDVQGHGMRLGETIHLPMPENDDALVFIAGAERHQDAWRNTGGRVLGVTATGATLEEARRKAYEHVRQISFAGAHWRRDIGS